MGWYAAGYVLKGGIPPHWRSMVRFFKWAAREAERDSDFLNWREMTALFESFIPPLEELTRAHDEEFRAHQREGDSYDDCNHGQCSHPRLEKTFTVHLDICEENWRYLTGPKFMPNADVDSLPTTIAIQDGGAIGINMLYIYAGYLRPTPPAEL